MSESESQSQGSTLTPPLEGLNMSVSSPPPQFGGQSPLAGLQSSLVSGKFSDLMIVHGVRRWNAHRVIVCSQSTILESMITVSSTGTNILDLTPYNEEAVRCLIDFLYSRDYSTADQPPTFSLPHHITVFNLATHFRIPALQKTAAAKFQWGLNERLEDVAVFFNLILSVYTPSDSPPPPASTGTSEDEGARGVADEAKNEAGLDGALKEVVVQATLSEMSTILASEHRDGFLALTSEVPDFQVGLYTMLLEHPLRPLVRVEVEVEKVVGREWQVTDRVLCAECGPRDEADGYVLERLCRGCGEVKELEFF